MVPQGVYTSGFDSEGDEHVLRRVGDVAIDGDRIVHVGWGYDGPVDERIDADSRLVSHELIDMYGIFGVDMHQAWPDGPREPEMGMPADVDCRSHPNRPLHARAVPRWCTTQPRQHAPLWSHNLLWEHHHVVQALGQSRTGASNLCGACW